MRLLKFDDQGELTVTRDLHANIPPYAILSHTWGKEEDEVTFEDVQNKAYKHLPGYAKIRFCGEQAKKDNLVYFWVDTCAIDKRSSAELQEAINSMFMWYEEAAICYAYLSDFPDAMSVDGEECQFRKAGWHSRGWTLQELLAPRNVTFYTHDWTFIGTKRSLCKQLSDITGIDLYIIMRIREIASASVAQRMSWASRRQTTRAEDTAYCLMGIFSVNMPMLYGEGERAFLRLQEEICKDSDDNSIFAWRTIDEDQDGGFGYGLMAEHPRHFQDSGRLGPYHFDSSLTFYTSIVNRGIQMESFLLPLDPWDPTLRILVLRGVYIQGPDGLRQDLGILVQKQLNNKGHMYVRIKTNAFILSRHFPHSMQKVLLAKSGRHDGWISRDLGASPYSLGPVQPDKSGEPFFQVAPVYLDQRGLTPWRVIAWTARQPFRQRIETDERKRLGQITFIRNDNKTQCTIQLAIRRVVESTHFFSRRFEAYSGEVSWLAESSSEIWLALKEFKFTREHAEHVVHVFADDFSELGLKERDTKYLSFTFVIRVL
jgi:hypothetical protein